MALYNAHFDNEDIIFVVEEVTLSSVSDRIKKFFGGNQIAAEKWLKPQLKKISWENTKEEKEAIIASNKKILANILMLAEEPKKICIVGFQSYNTKEEAEKATSINVVSLPNETTFYKPYISRFVDYDPEKGNWVGEVSVFWGEKELL